MACLLSQSLIDINTDFSSLLVVAPLKVADVYELRGALLAWQRLQERLLPFAVRFAVEKLVANNRMDPVVFLLTGSAIISDFVGLLTAVDSESACLALAQMALDPSEWSHAPVEALHKALAMCTSSHKSPLHDIGSESELSVDINDATTRRVFLTPLRICPQSDARDLSNRVIRQYIQFKHRFLRVTLLDEDFSSLSKSGSVDIFSGRMKGLVRDGFPMAGRRFVFLGYSNSQMREHSCWFYDEAPGHDEDSPGAAVPSAGEIRAWIGDLRQIESVGKFAARLGQGFSASVNSLEVLPDEVATLSDELVKIYCHKTNEWKIRFNFSDGVGMIRAEFAKEISADISAFQIRYGGCKGMLSVAPAGHPAFADPCTKIAVRPSMRKFESAHHMLEIVGLSKVMPMYLNRQIVPILTAMGVTDALFMTLLNDMLASLQEITTDNKTALNMLQLQGNSGGVEINDVLSSDNTSTFSVDVAPRMLNCGFDVSREPFLLGVVSAIRNRLLLDLQLKARIFVPDAVCLYGVMDETGLLQEGQVFVQYTDRATGLVATLQGVDVLVGRSPSLHPGDIRKLRAVFVPALAHLVDVVVFPSQRRRPHPNEMSGGDLDGDIYFVIRDKRLVSQCTKQFPAMDFTPATTSQPVTAAHASGVTALEIGDFFVDYIQNDNLGLIANAHVGWSDRSNSGVLSSKCVELAALHSTAVDFPKSGVPAVFSSDLNCELWPDFKEYSQHRTYQSSKALGQIYRATKAVMEAEGGRGGAEFTPEINSSSSSNCQVDQDLCVQTWLQNEADKVYFAAAMDTATELLHSYNYSLWQLMCQYEVWSEAELLSGFVCRFAARVSKERGSHDNNQGRLNRAVRDLRAHYLSIFRKEFGEDCDRGWLARLKASAWYQVCYCQCAATREEGERALRSFAWIPCEYLCEIKRQRLHQRKQHLV